MNIQRQHKKSISKTQKGWASILLVLINTQPNTYENLALWQVTCLNERSSICQRQVYCTRCTNVHRCVSTRVAVRRSNSSGSCRSTRINANSFVQLFPWAHQSLSPAKCPHLHERVHRKGRTFHSNCDLLDIHNARPEICWRRRLYLLTYLIK